MISVKVDQHVTDLVDGRSLEGELEVLRPMSGSINRVTWVAKIESLAAVHAINKRFAEDSDWIKLNEGGEGLYTTGSFEDQFFEKLL